MIAAAKPTTIETRVPTRSCERTSEPFSVVPSGWLHVGGGEHVGARGVRVVGSEQRAEDGDERARRRAPRVPKRPRQVSSRRSSPRMPPPVAHRVLHPRVEEEVEAVGDQVGEDHPGAEDEERPLQHGEVLVVDRVVAELAEARPGEDRLDRDRARRRRRRTGSPTSVTSGSSALGTAWRLTTRSPRHPGRALDGDEVLGHHVDHRRAHDQEVLAEQHQRHRGRRQDQVGGDVERPRPTSSRTRPPASSADRRGRSARRPRRGGSG